MTEFKVNDYITLKLEGRITTIYVKDMLFNQCKFLFMNILDDQVSDLDEINSIDEASERLNGDLERNIREYNITPEQEFWGHCSNMQAWAENEYDTRFLHSNLSFPLIKKLTEVGDTIAKKKFKDEIANRVEDGYSPVIEYLIRNGYFKYFNEEELELIKEKLWPKQIEQALQGNISTYSLLETAIKNDCIIEGIERLWSNMIIRSIKGDKKAQSLLETAIKNDYKIPELNDWQKIIWPKTIIRPRKGKNPVGTKFVFDLINIIGKNGYDVNKRYDKFMERLKYEGSNLFKNPYRLLKAAIEVYSDVRSIKKLCQSVITKTMTESSEGFIDSLEFIYWLGYKAVEKGHDIPGIKKIELKEIKGSKRKKCKLFGILKLKT